MFYIVFALFLFMASVTVHVYFCRKKAKPGLQAKAFIFTAIIFLCIYALGVILLRHGGMMDPRSLWGTSFEITAGIIFILLVPVYLCFYVLTQLTSPSKRILSTIAQRGEASYKDILACVQKEDFITSRLNDLCASHCVKQVDSRLSLTKEGQKVAATLKLMQLIFGRNVGG
jgi:hypothetical protein